MILADYLDKSECSAEPDLAKIVFTSLVSDTRKATKDCLFLSLPYHGSDTLSLLKDTDIMPCAIITEIGASIPIKYRNIPIIFVANPRKTLSYLWSRICGNPQDSMKIIGVTGTSGKSSTSDMLYQVLNKLSCHAALIGTVHCITEGKNYNTRESLTMTTPEPEILYPMLKAMKNDGVSHVVMEVSSQSLSEERVAPIEFEIGIFLNLSPEHLDFHGSMEAYFIAKSKLFHHCRNAVINIDDPSGIRLLSHVNGNAVTVGAESDADYRITDICTEKTTSYTMLTDEYALPVFVPLPGIFTAVNSALTFAALQIFGFPPISVTEALSTVVGTPGRMELLQDSGLPFSVLIDYAHTADAMKKLLISARLLTKNRIVVVFGCGGNRDRQKRKFFSKIAEKYADYSVITSDNCRTEAWESILADILSGFSKEARFTVIRNRRDAIIHALNTAQAGDMVILAGKGHESYEIDKDGVRPFSEKEIVIEYAEKRSKQDYEN